MDERYGELALDVLCCAGVCVVAPRDSESSQTLCRLKSPEWETECV